MIKTDALEIMAIARPALERAGFKIMESGIQSDGIRMDLKRPNTEEKFTLTIYPIIDLRKKSIDYLS